MRRIAPLLVVCATVVAGTGVTGLYRAAPAHAASQFAIQSEPVDFTPWLLASTPNQVVRELVPCGRLMYAVGTISNIGQGSHTYHRSNAFSFSQATGVVTSWNPQVNGQVNSIDFSSDCTTAYLGGDFSRVHGVTAHNLAAVSTRTGRVVRGFRHNANHEVQTVQFEHGRLFVGGAFTRINGTARAKLASLNRTTGKVTDYSRITVTGEYPRTWTRVYNSQISHDHQRMLIEGVFTSLAGKPRQQMAVLDFTRSRLTLDKWTSTEFTRACHADESFYVRAGAWSPDDTTIYAASTGYKPASGTGSRTTQPRSGLCDSVAAFPFRHGAVHHRWINYTGCDSLYGVAATRYAVYITGHERWANNSHGCNAPGPGAVPRRGIAAISPSTGLARAWNPTRALGHGGDDMTLTRAGLWVASDNWKNGQAQQCGGHPDHGGICFLPYSGS